MSKHKKVQKCSCSWKDTCCEIRKQIMNLPDGDIHELWKQPHVQIRKTDTEKNNKFISVIKRHLGIKGDCPDSLNIAPHHFQLALLEHHHQCKTLKWSGPLSMQEAKRFNNSTSKIDLHPDSKENIHLFYRTPNMPKQEVLWKLKQWSSESKKKKLEMKHVSSEPPPVSNGDLN